MRPSASENTEEYIAFHWHKIKTLEEAGNKQRTMTEFKKHEIKIEFANLNVRCSKRHSDTINTVLSRHRQHVDTCWVAVFSLHVEQTVYNCSDFLLKISVIVVRHWVLPLVFSSCMKIVIVFQNIFSLDVFVVCSECHIYNHYLHLSDTLTFRKFKISSQPIA